LEKGEEKEKRNIICSPRGKRKLEPVNCREEEKKKRIPAVVLERLEARGGGGRRRTMQVKMMTIFFLSIEEKKGRGKKAAIAHDDSIARGKGNGGRHEGFNVKAHAPYCL